MNEFRYSCDSGQKRRSMLRLMSVPTLFSILVWTAVPTEPTTITSRNNPSINLFSIIPKLFSSTLDEKDVQDPSLVPKSLHDSYQLGYISAQLENIQKMSSSSKDRNSHASEVQRLLDESKRILKLQSRISIEQATGGVAEAAKIKDAEKGYIARFMGALSFLNVLSFLSLAGIVITLLPALQHIWEAWRLDRLFSIFVSWIKKIEDTVQPLVEMLLFAIPLKIYYLSLNLLIEGYSGSNQMAALSAAISGFIYIFYSFRKHNNEQIGDSTITVSYLWVASFLIPMATNTSSKFLGFFAIGAIYGALGFVACPTPFGWAAGFSNEGAMDRSIVVSLIIILSLIFAKTLLHETIPYNVQSTFQLGASVFGMIAFGIAGLIKSAMLSEDVPLVLSGLVNPKALIYPISWVLFSCVGYIIPIQSLANSSVTFIILWMSQFCWRFVGAGALGIFSASVLLFFATLFLKMHPEFFASFFIP